MVGAEIGVDDARLDLDGEHLDVVLVLRRRA